MKLTVKTLKGSNFEIAANPNDSVMAIKKIIEEIQGEDSYPWRQQLLIHNGKVLKDESTLDDNNVCENGFLVVMLSKTKNSGTSGTSRPLTISSPAFARPQQLALVPPSVSDQTSGAHSEAAFPAFARPPQLAPASDQTSEANGEAASNLVVQSNTEQLIQQLISMGSGSWDRETILRALDAAYNNPERAVEYLYSGIPETAEVSALVAQFPSGEMLDQARSLTEESAPISDVPNSSPLNIFPEGIAVQNDDIVIPESLDFLRESVQFQRVRSMCQANPHIIEPMLQEVGKKNPRLLTVIQEHYTEFLELLNETDEEAEGDEFDQSEPEMTHAVGVTQEEQNAIERLVTMGFERQLVIEAFLACDKNEELAANYLLEHSGEEDD